MLNAGAIIARIGSLGIVGSSIAASSVLTIPTTTTHKVTVTANVTHALNLFSIPSFHINDFFKGSAAKIE